MPAYHGKAQNVSMPAYVEFCILASIFYILASMFYNPASISYILASISYISGLRYFSMPVYHGKEQSFSMPAYHGMSKVSLCQHIRA
jgi:hypothetical protein